MDTTVPPVKWKLHRMVSCFTVLCSVVLRLTFARRLNICITEDLFHLYFFKKEETPGIEHRIQHPAE